MLSIYSYELANETAKITDTVSDEVDLLNPAISRVNVRKFTNQFVRLDVTLNGSGTGTITFTIKGTPITGEDVVEIVSSDAITATGVQDLILDITNYRFLKVEAEIDVTGDSTFDYTATLFTD